jgi:two-component system, NarL family, nitrate/nitrite response regulator NarL
MSPPSTSIRVLVADDQRLFADAVSALLAGEPRIEVVGRARDGVEAVELARSLQPDVILMDISMPRMDGFDATERIRADDPDARILILSGSNSREDVDRSREAGASGYLTKDRIAAQLVDAILSVARRDAA